MELGQLIGVGKKLTKAGCPVSGDLNTTNNREVRQGDGGGYIYCNLLNAPCVGIAGEGACPKGIPVSELTSFFSNATKKDS